MTDLGAYLAECRELVLPAIAALIPKGSPHRAILYDRMLEYALREAKMLRPAIAVASCRALGGRLEEALPSAAVLELYHNAFLIHDDVEDRSELRRDRPTLHGMYGVPIAVNVGDAMLALALDPLLDNMRTLGIGKALRILDAVARMARESAEGQAIELEWMRAGSFDLEDADYVRMVEKKTSFYSFITPAAVGGIIAGADADLLAALARFCLPLGVAFQIQDDVLNLTGDYGKEARGDLWEGKHTLVLLHVMRSATAAERIRLRAILDKPRPSRLLSEGPAEGAQEEPSARLGRLVEGLVAAGEISGAAREALEREIAVLGRQGPAVKTAADVEELGALIDRYGSIAYARDAAGRWAAATRTAFDAVCASVRPSVHRDFLGGLVDYVVERSR